MITRNAFRSFVAIVCTLVVAAIAVAQEPYKEHAGHKIFYTAFNSSFIQPDIAQLYELTRGSDQGLVNIAVVKSSPEGDSLGLPVKVSGSATNLIMQTNQLDFTEIRDGEAVYYLAPFEFENEEVIHFDIEVEVAANTAPLSFRFTRTFYED